MPTKHWALLFRWDGKLKEMRLGSVISVSLAEARRQAGEYRGMLARNIIPIEVRREEERKRAEEGRKRATGRTFGEVGW